MTLSSQRLWVFLNIPYYTSKDGTIYKTYPRIEAAIKAALLFVGIRPVLAREYQAASLPATRLDKIAALIDDSIGMITDISAPDRLNMPLELGLACCRKGKKPNLVFEDDKYKYQYRISDLLGLDPRCYADGKAAPDILAAEHVMSWLEGLGVIQRGTVAGWWRQLRLRRWIDKVRKRFEAVGGNPLDRETDILDDLVRKSPDPRAMFPAPDREGCTELRRIGLQAVVAAP